jgi:hypothetical protein
MRRHKSFQLVKLKDRLWIVILRSTGESVATLYRQGGDDTSFRFRLDNYPQSLSKVYRDEKQALDAIEREVL